MASNSITLTLDFGLLGDREAQVMFWHTPEEATTHEHQGWPEQIEIQSVIVSGLGEIIELLTDDAEKEIGKMILDKIDNQEAEGDTF